LACERRSFCTDCRPKPTFGQVNRFIFFRSPLPTSGSLRVRATGKGRRSVLVVVAVAVADAAAAVAAAAHASATDRVIETAVFLLLLRYLNMKS
jgi:hypothetical protein